MRKIIVLEFMSLDGVIQAPGGSKEDAAEGFKFGGWTAPFFDDDSSKEMDKQMKGDYDLLLGRKTYDIWKNYWPDHTEFWPQVNKITKYVVSKTLKDPSWENTVVLSDVEELKKIKNTEGTPLQVYGSAKLFQTLMKHDLVDELWLKTYPLTLGTGKKLFEEGTMPATFALIDSKITSSGVVFASYKRDGKIKTGEIEV